MKGIHDFARSVAAPPLSLGAAVQLGALGLGLAAAVQGLGWHGQVLALAFYGGIGALVLCGLDLHAPHRSFGAANLVTAARAAAVAFLLGVWGEAALTGAVPGAGLRWLLCAVAAAALAADGLDGWLARRSGLASDFGARFDMETDALLVLTLALLAYGLRQAGVFVLLSGALRYVFVAAGWLAPALAAPLRPSWRRKFVCVAQTSLLIAALAPPVPLAAAQTLCALGLALLLYSFAVDSAGMLSSARGSHIMARDVIAASQPRTRRQPGERPPVAPGRSRDRRSAPRRDGGAGS